MDLSRVVSSSDVREAVRRLRAALNLNQSEFARLLGKGIATIQRYETLVPPKGRVLADLERLADENGLPRYAVIFHDALKYELGDVPSRLHPRVNPGQIYPVTREEEFYVHALLQVLRDKGGQYKDLRLRVIEVLAPSLDDVYDGVEQGEKWADEEAMIFNLNDQGIPTDEIAKRIDNTEDYVVSVLSQRRTFPNE